MSKLSRILITIFISLTVFNCKSQNLILNGSFENYTNPLDCGNGGFYNQYYYPAPHVLDNWEEYNSCDYFTTYCPHYPGQLGFEIPASWFGYSPTKNGNAYVGFGPYTNGNEYKEYLYQHLSNPLQAGKVYCLSFYVTRADRGTFAIENIDAYFTATLPTLISNMYISASPQVLNQNGIISDTTQWTNIQGCFTAVGGEQYMIIGNFNSNANTDSLMVGTNNPIPNMPSGYAYYFIDDITLIDQMTVGVKHRW